jgi:hypothetical protein
MRQVEKIAELQLEIDRLKDLIALRSFAADSLTGPHGDWGAQLLKREAELRRLKVDDSAA